MSEHDRPGEVDPAVDPAGEQAVADGASERGEGESVRRVLIRATLKPQEGVPPTPRQPPVFTMHQQPRGGASGAARGNFRARSGRPDRANGHPEVNGNTVRPARRNERGGQQRLNSSSRSASSRRGKGRSR